MKCHYEVLDVPRDANNDDLKKAYRKAALKWHPDKNLDNAEEAKEQFQLVQQAYEVLTDPHERSWYDSHRDAILKGGLGGDYKDDTFDVFPYFTTSCFKGFDDDENGFYSVYREVFKKVAAEDAEYMEDGDSDFEIPEFGKSTSDFMEVVQPFYAYWSNYTTKKSFSWLDQYDIRDLPNRRVAKLVEKENKKIRDRARKDRNEQIRNLVAFVRKRDRRVQAQAKVVEQLHAEKARKSEEKRKEKLREKQAQLKDYQESEWAKFSNVENELKNIEKSIQAEYGDHDSSCDEDIGPEETADIDIEMMATDGFYCPACQKLFKTDKAFANHEKSKKHKENVELLKQAMLDEEEELEAEMDEEEDEEEQDEEGDEEESLGSDEECDEESVEEIEVEQPDSLPNQTDDEKVKLKETNGPEEGDEDIDERQNTNSGKQPTVDGDDSDQSSDEEFAMLSKKQRRKLQQQKLLLKKTHVEEGDPPQNNMYDNSDVKAEVEDDVNSDSNEADVPKAKLKGKKAKEARKQKRLAEASASTDVKNVIGTARHDKRTNNSKGKHNEDLIDVEHACVTCKSNFSSKNKLFDHLKKTGHSVFIPKSSGGATFVEEKKGKARRK